MGSVRKGSALLLGLVQALVACGRTEHDGPGVAQPSSPAEGGSASADPVTGIATSGAAATGAGAGLSVGTSGGLANGEGGAAGFLSISVGGQPAMRAPLPSPGCSELPAQALGQYTQYSVHVTGATLDPAYTAPAHERGYAVWLPPDYTPTQAYRTVFIASNCGGSDTSEIMLMGGDNSFPEAIYVGLAPPPVGITPNGCTDNSGLKSVEWEYFALVASAVEAAVCVDKNDELVTGRRSGGTLANMLGCYFSGVDAQRKFGPNLSLRAQLSFASGLPVDLPKCGGPIAGLWMHDPNETNPLTDSSSSRDRVLALDGCADNNTQPWGSGPLEGIGCERFVSCPASYPVIFCETPNRGRQSNYYGLTTPAYVQLAAALMSAP